MSLSEFGVAADCRVRHAWRVRQKGEIEHLRSALADARVAGAADFGRFVNDTTARQMIVYALWRCRRQLGICAALPNL